MKKLIYLPIIMLMCLMLACSGTNSQSMVTPKEPHGDSLSEGRYENELFSFRYPEGWIVDASEWHGLDAMRNEVNLSMPGNSLVSLRFVKTFLPMKWKNMDEATQWAKMSRGLSGDAELFDETDSVEIGGYPSHLLSFVIKQENDTLIQNQYVTYLPESHILMYFNSVFHYKDWDDAEPLGDAIISTIQLKKVQNPLDEEGAVQKAYKQAIKDGVISEKDLEEGKKFMTD